MAFSRSALLIPCLALLPACSTQTTDEAPQPSPDAFAGRWDVTVKTAEGSHPSWLELTREGGQFSGRFVGQVGHARPVSDITVEGATLKFTLPTQYEEMESDLSFTGVLADGSLSGRTNANAPGGTELDWTAVRAPGLGRHSGE
jgi:hypothetical protein